MKIKINETALVIGAFFISVFVIIYLLLMSGVFSSFSNILPSTEIGEGQGINFMAIFLTGLLTGGLTCLAVQGGLLAATIATREEEKLKEKVKGGGNAGIIIAFISSKLFAYTIFGFLLGLFGSLFQMSITTQIIMQMAVIIFMLGTALNILNVHPIFRYFAIQPPKALTRLVRKQSKSKNFFAPVLLGAFTVFIPCGTTQAMMALAIGSGSPLVGAGVLFAFVLGTSPVFFLLGYFATKLGDTLQKRFMKIAAAALIILALFNLNNTLALMGFSFNSDSSKNEVLDLTEVIEDVDIAIVDNGYLPSIVNVKAGSDVTFRIRNDGSYTCASAFTIPSYNFQKIIAVGTTETITLKMPNKKTQIPFMCSMGMYRGTINVI